MRRVTLIVGLVAICLLALAPAATARSRIGSDYLVKPGQTIVFTNITISACNTLFFGADRLRADGSTLEEITMASNAGFECAFTTHGDRSFTNETSEAQLFRLWIVDQHCNQTYLAGSDHSRLTNRQAAFNDAGAACEFQFVPLPPARVKGQLDGNVVTGVSID